MEAKTYAPGVEFVTTLPPQNHWFLSDTGKKKNNHNNDQGHCVEKSTAIGNPETVDSLQ